jgi:hypothetical protein
MAANPLTAYLITMALLGTVAAVLGAALYRGHRPLGAAIGFAIGIMISPLISDMILPTGVGSEEVALPGHDPS